MKTVLHSRIFNAFLLSIMLSFCIQAQDASADTLTLFEHLYSDVDHIPMLKIHTGVKELFKGKSITQEYYIPGTMSISQADGNDFEFTSRFKIRGNTRKKVCDNAPIKIDFVGSELRSLGLEGSVDKIKLVLQCENGSRNVQQLLKEKLIYDLYGAIDSNSMRVKIINVEMYEKGELKENMMAFIVEDEEAYAHRKNARILEKGKINYAALPRPEYFKLCFFQYMIANCDWSIANKHNIELVKLPNVKTLVSVPYDFDYAGFVNNSYAVPPEHFPITTVTQRYFMIRTDMTQEEVDTVIDYYENKKDEFYAIVDQQEHMDERTKKSSRSFLSGFYKKLENRGKIVKAVKPK